MSAEEVVLLPDGHDVDGAWRFDSRCFDVSKKWAYKHVIVYLETRKISICLPKLQLRSLTIL